MHKMFADVIGNFVLVYLDDILVFSKSPEEHLQHLRFVLDRFRQYDLFAARKKCQFNLAELKYLGHVVSADGVKPDPLKTQVVHDWPQPRDRKDLRSFLGLANYFRRFVQGYSKMVLPLTDLLREYVKWDWSPACQTAFDRVKVALTQAPVLATPDFTVPFEVICDASGDRHHGAIGAVLLQNGRPVAYESRKLTPAEINYTTTEQEMLAVVHAVVTWRCYLEGPLNGGPRFTIVTDHYPTTFFEPITILSRRQARWAEILADFTCLLEYRPGRMNVADPLSRIPVAPTGELVLSALASAHLRLLRGRLRLAPSLRLLHVWWQAAETMVGLPMLPID